MCEVYARRVARDPVLYSLTRVTDYSPRKSDESGGDGASKRQTPLEHVDSHKLRAILLRKKGKRDWQAACDTLWWAIEHEPEEVQPIHFNIVLASLAAATEWERCLVLLEHDMPRSGLGLGCGTGQTRTPQPEP